MTLFHVTIWVPILWTYLLVGSEHDPLYSIVSIGSRLLKSASRKLFSDPDGYGIFDLYGVRQFWNVDIYLC